MLVGRKSTGRAPARGDFYMGRGLCSMADKVRVLQVIDSLGNAGAETLQRTFAEGLDRSRFELHVCGLRPTPGSVTLPALRALGVPVMVLNQRTSYDLPALLALVRYIRRHRIDIV